MSTVRVVWRRLGGLALPADVALLSEEERLRAARFRYEADHARFVQAHAFLRRVLGELVARPPTDLRFGKLTDGKPYLEDCDLELSFAHCRGLAVVAAGREGPLGVDVEEVAAGPIEEALLHAALAPAEIAHFRTLPESVRATGFRRAWTRKEAVLKARGEGLGTAPNQVDVTGSEALGWVLTDLPLEAPWVGALASSATCVLDCFEAGDVPGQRPSVVGLSGRAR
jgi:4'-phosphopantetheinyl transferase